MCIRDRDLAFILVFRLGVAGASLATVLSQGVSGLACLVYMVKKFPILHMSREERQLDVRSCRALCFMGVPMGLQYSITAIGSIFLQSAVNSLGSLYVAGVAAGKMCIRDRRHRDSTDKDSSSRSQVEWLEAMWLMFSRWRASIHWSV